MLYLSIETSCKTSYLELLHICILLRWIELIQLILCSPTMFASILKVLANIEGIPTMQVHIKI